MRGVPRLVLSVALFLVVSHVIVPMKARLYANAGTCAYYGSAY